MRSVSIIRAAILIAALCFAGAADVFAAKPIPLTAPSLSASATSSSSIALSWTDPNNRETGYEIQRSLSATTGFVTVHTAAEDARSWTNNGLSSGTRYYYRARALGNGSKTSDWSNTTSAQTSGGGGAVDTTPPSVSLSSSLSGTVTSNSTVVLTASASDNVGVTRVEFYDTGVVRATDTSAPYQASLSLNAGDNGIHYYLAVAYDAAGNIGYSTWIILTVNIGSGGSDTTPPSVAFITPTSNTTYTSAQTTRAEVSASDPSGIDRIEFRLDNVLRCTETVAPYTCDWNITSANNGSHFWSARAYDTVGNNQTVNVSFSVNIGSGDTQQPGVSIWSPTSGTTFSSSSTVTITAIASDNVGVTRVEFLRNNSLYSSDTTSPYTASWPISSSTNGTWSWTARAFDAAGNTRTSSAASYTVNIGGGGGDTTLPNVSISSPASGATYTSNQTVTITASASDNVGVTKVEFYDNGVLRRVDSASPYTHAWAVDSSQNGSHSWTAKAFDAAGNTRTSGSVVLSVSIGGGGGGDPALIGFVPGAGVARDVTVNAAQDLAYVASDDFGLSIFDVSVPSDPVALGSPLEPFEGSSVAYSGSRAVVGSLADGFRVVDISNPALPVVLGAIDTLPVHDVAVSGNYAYLRVQVSGNPSHNDLVTVSLSNPSNPTVVNQKYLSGGDNDVVLANGKLYATTGAGLQIYSLSNPAAPSAQGFASVSGGTRDVAVSGSYAYVVSGSRLQVVNVSNANNPSLGTWIGTGGTVASVVGSRLYVVSGDDVNVYSLSNPASPSSLGNPLSYNAQGVSGDGTVMFLASPDPVLGGGLYIVNAASPSSANLVGQAPASFANSGVASNGSLALSASRETGLHVVDVSNPALAERIGGIESIQAADVALSGNYAYLRVQVAGNPSHNDLVTVSLSNPSNPTIVDQQFQSGGGDDVLVANGKLYVTTGAGLQIYSLSNPARPSAQGFVSISGGTNDVVVSGSYAYVVNSSRLQIVNVSNANSPQVVGNRESAGTVLAHSGSHLYQVRGDFVDILSLGNPTNPSLVATVTSSNAKGMAVTGGRLYLATDADGLRVYDVANPASPQSKPTIGIPGSGRSAHAVGGHLYVGDTASLVDVIDVVP